jgi:hypothetical protein
VYEYQKASSLEKRIILLPKPSTNAKSGLSFWCSLQVYPKLILGSSVGSLRDLTMKLLIQLFVIAALILTSASVVTAENVIRYLYSDGNFQTGLECTPSDIKKIATIFDAINTPSNLRKRSVEQPARELQSKLDTIHQINFDDAGFSADDTASYHLPSCDDKCNGYHPDKCFASNIKDKKGYRHRDLQLASANFTKVVVGEVSNAIYPANCKSLCAGQVSGMCMGVPGCQGYRRELVANKQEERDDDKRRDLQLASANFTKVVVGEVSNAIYPANCKTLCAGQVSGMCMGVPGCQGYRRELTGGKQEERDLMPLNTTSAKENGIYPPYCRDRCVYYPVGHCLEPGCVGYRRQRQLATKGDNERDLQLASANFTKVLVGEGTNSIYPANCKTLCAGQVSGMCMGVPGCQGYRRELTGGKPDERDLTPLNTTSAMENGIYPPYCRDRCVYYPVGHCLEPGCVGYRRRRQLTTDPTDWCAKASQAIDEKLNIVLRELSPQCRALILAPRRKECYDDAVICGAK